MSVSRPRKQITRGHHKRKPSPSMHWVGSSGGAGGRTQDPFPNAHDIYRGHGYPFRSESCEWLGRGDVQPERLGRKKMFFSTMDLLTFPGVFSGLMRSTPRILGHGFYVIGKAAPRAQAFTASPSSSAGTYTASPTFARITNLGGSQYHVSINCSGTLRCQRELPHLPATLRL